MTALTWALVDCLDRSEAMGKAARKKIARWGFNEDIAGLKPRSPRRLTYRDGQENHPRFPEYRRRRRDLRGFANVATVTAMRVSVTGTNGSDNAARGGLRDRSVPGDAASLSPSRARRSGGCECGDPVGGRRSGYSLARDSSHDPPGRLIG